MNKNLIFECNFSFTIQMIYLRNSFFYLLEYFFHVQSYYKLKCWIKFKTRQSAR